MTVVKRFVQAVSHGGMMQNPTLIVIHSAETPLAAGYAYSIAKNWFGSKASGVTTSAHFIADPVEVIRMLSDNVVSYAVGPKANGFTLNIEQSGRASFTRAQWMTSAGMAQHGLVGALIDELCKANGIPKRWATDAQIRDAARGMAGGICFHDDIRRVLGGTTHTDPKPNYPADVLWTPGAKAPAPAAPEEEDDDMPATFFTTTDRPNEPWWLVNGFQRRVMAPGEPDLMVQAGLAKWHGTGKVAVVPAWAIDKLPIVK